MPRMHNRKIPDYNQEDKVIDHQLIVQSNKCLQYKSFKIPYQHRYNMPNNQQTIQQQIQQQQDLKKTSYQTYIDLKHRLYNNNSSASSNKYMQSGQPTSRPPSTNRNSNFQNIRSNEPSVIVSSPFSRKGSIINKENIFLMDKDQSILSKRNLIGSINNSPNTLGINRSNVGQINNQSSLIRSRKQSVVKGLDESETKIHNVSGLSTRRGQSGFKLQEELNDVRVVYVNVKGKHIEDDSLMVNNKEQVFKALSRGNSINREPQVEQPIGAANINININNLFNIQGQNQTKRGYLRDQTNMQISSSLLIQQRSPINASRNDKFQFPHTPKQNHQQSEQFPQSKKNVLNQKPKQDTALIKFQELQDQYNKIKSKLVLGPYAQKEEVKKDKNSQNESMSFLKNYQLSFNQKGSIENSKASLFQEPSKQSISYQPVSSRNLLNGLQTSFKNSIIHLEDSFQLANEPITKQNFIFHFVVGKGGFGKVWKVELKKNRMQYAMKEMSKSKIIAKRSVASVMNEKNLLTQLKHSFIVNMSFAFQDRENLYLAMDLLTGGDLRFHVGKQRRFKEHQTSLIQIYIYCLLGFFIACIVLALEYLHNNNIIHRDLKPENLVLDQNGYVYLTDLGIARQLRPDNSSDTSGTPGYMAPEVMCRQNHGIAADYFALGVIAYEFMMGKRPYSGRSRNEIRDQILAKQVQIKKTDAPEDYSTEAVDFANKLLQRKSVSRLGFNGPDEVKQHPWIKDFPWDSLLSKELLSPYIPISIDTNADYRNQISMDDIESNEDLIKQNQLMLRRDSVQNLFAGYEKTETTQIQQF